MTINNLIEKVNEEKPNSFSETKLIAYINEVEAEVCEQLNLTGTPYANSAEDKAKTLLAPVPYDRLYVSYLKAQIDYANEEYESYANNQAQHTQDFRDFTDWVVRTGQVESNPFPTRFFNV